MSRYMVVYLVYFGPTPPWLPVSLASMRWNPRITFAFVGDTELPAAPPNVVQFRMSYAEMQTRLSALVGATVRYTEGYKANDIKPFAGALFANFTRGFEWWAWADADVVFGDLERYMRMATSKPACCANLTRGRDLNIYRRRSACPCAQPTAVDLVTPLHPNPWNKKIWGPFTAIRDPARTMHLPMRAPGWRGALTDPSYRHFDEWWGAKATLGETIDALVHAGELVPSREKLPFGEAKTCDDANCGFCPCGVVSFSLSASGLILNEATPAMLLHLAESKPRWSVISARECARWEVSRLGRAASTPRIRRHRADGVVDYARGRVISACRRTSDSN